MKMLNVGNMAIPLLDIQSVNKTEERDRTNSQKTSFKIVVTLKGIYQYPYCSRFLLFDDKNTRDSYYDYIVNEMAKL